MRIPRAEVSRLVSQNHLRPVGRPSACIALAGGVLTAPPGRRRRERWTEARPGPRPDSPESLDTYAPMSARSWYRRTGGGGVVAPFATRDGMQIKSP